MVQTVAQPGRDIHISVCVPNPELQTHGDTSSRFWHRIVFEPMSAIHYLGLTELAVSLPL